MRKMVGMMIFCLVILEILVNFANALDKTSTGFYYPIGEEDFNTEDGWWLSKDPDYFRNYYHIGVDMMTETNDPSKESSQVYAISDGVVIKKHQSSDSWGSTNGVANYGVFVKHKASDGSEFVALYGHIQPYNDVVENKPVKAGQKIGYTGYYLYDNWQHLHFGIHPGSSVPYSNSSAGIGWGRMTVANWPNQNGFTNPITFIQNSAPFVDFSDTSKTIEATVRIVGDAAWYPPNVDCFDAQKWFRVTGSTRNYADRLICFEIIGACPAFP